MKTLCLFLLLAIPSSANAALPRLDSLSINEAKGQLTLFGAFPPNRGIVTVDSVAMFVYYWNDSMISCSIPDTGKGNAGSVIVFGNTGPSNALTISMWNCTINGFLAHSYSLGLEWISDLWKLHWRIWLRPNRLSSAFDGMSSSSDSAMYSLYLRSVDPNVPPDQKTDVYPYAPYHFQGTLDYRMKRITLSTMVWRNTSLFYLDVGSFYIQLDSGWNILAGSARSNNSNGGDPLVWKNSPVVWPPAITSATRQQYTSTFSVSLSDNPIFGMSHFWITAPNESIVTIAIYDVMGRRVRTNTIQVHLGKGDMPFDATSLAPGSYFYHATTESHSDTGKMIVM